LSMADGRLHLALAIGIADATGQRDDAVVRQHVAVERIERGVVDVRREHALAKIVEDDDLHGAAEAAETLLVQLAPAARARGEGQQADALATVAEREEEEARAAVLARARVAHHRAVAVIDCQRPPYIEPPGSGKLSHPGSRILSQAGSPILSHLGTAIESHPGQRDRIPSSFSPSLAILREHTTLQEVTSGGTEESGDRHP